MERGVFTMQPVHLARPNGRWMARPCGVSMTDCDLTPLSFPMIQGLYHIQQIVGEKKTKVPRSDFVILVCEEWVAVWIKMAISPEYIHVKDMWDFQISTSLTRNHRIKSPVFFFEGWRAHFIPTGSASTPALVWHLAIAQRERRSETSLFALTSEAWHCLNQENVTGDEG